MGWRIAVVSLAMFAVAPGWGGVAPEVKSQDAFLAGVLSTILEREFGWAGDSYELVVREGIATVTLDADAVSRREQLEAELPEVEGLQALQIAETGAPAPAEVPDSTGEPVYSALGLTLDTLPLPAGNLFWPLLADPKQPQFFLSLRRYDSPDDTATLGAVGFGETFGLYRREGKRPGDGLQVSIAGGLFAQFDMGAPSNDLVNADYLIGLPVSWRSGPWSAVARLYHQSSHLGDEFLLRARPERINLSYEALELLLSYDFADWRIYGGGEYMLHREPEDLDRPGLHGGLEYRGRNPWLFGGRFVAGLDVKSWGEQDWNPNASLHAGLEFGATQPGRRRVRIMAEAYDGFSPHGQFYEDEIRYYGVGLYFGF